jgi:hypothetical protein
VRFHRWNQWNETGIENTHLKLAVSLLEMFEDVVSLGCMLLMCLGWSTVHFRLTQIQIRVAAGALSLYLIMGMAAAGCLDTEAAACQGLWLVSYILQALIMLCVIISLNFTITQLRAMLYHTPWDPTSPYCYARTKQFQTFRIAFVLYLLMPTIILIIQDVVYTWEQDWLGTALPDIMQVLMYLNVGSAFAPLKDAFLNRAFSGAFTVNGEFQHDE